VPELWRLRGCITDGCNTHHRSFDGRGRRERHNRKSVLVPSASSSNNAQINTATYRAYPTHDDRVNIIFAHAKRCTGRLVTVSSVLRGRFASLVREINTIISWWACIKMDWIELNWIELNRIELNWIELNRIELNWIELNWIELYCIVLYCIVLYCIVLYCIVLYCIVLYCIVLHCIVLYCIVLYCIVLYCIVLNWIIKSNRIDIIYQGLFLLYSR
jgi:hypothetical protein